MIYLAILLSIAASALLVARARRQKCLALMTPVADGFGLQIQLHGPLTRPNVTGEIDGLSACINMHQESQGESVVCVAITAQASGGISLRPPGPEPSFDAKAGLDAANALEIGDPRFDTWAVVHGPERTVRALLDAGARKAVLAALNDGITVVDGVVLWTHVGMTNTDELEAGVRKACAFAQVLRRPCDDDALATIVRQGVCDVAIGALNVMQPGSIRDALVSELIENPADALVMAAAAYASESAALSVQQVLAKAKNPAPLRAQALRWLGRHIDATQLARDYLLKPGFTEAALDVLEGAGTSPNLAALAQLPTTDVDVALQVVRAARRIGAAAETLLLDVLEAHQGAVAIAAAKALGEIGTTAAVHRLRERAKDIYITLDVREVVLDAVKALQGRVTVERGGLSVPVDSTKGHLTVVEASAAGRLSETKSR